MTWKKKKKKEIRATRAKTWRKKITNSGHDPPTASNDVSLSSLYLFHPDHTLIHKQPTPSPQPSSPSSPTHTYYSPAPHYPVP
jgi:hypothetical protein